MQIAKIKYPDIANGPGVRVSLFLQGCHHRCPGCFNQETWDPEDGRPFNSVDERYIEDLLSKWYVSGISILGGEPLEQHYELMKFLQRLKHNFPDKTVWLWTGFKYDNVKDSSVFNYVDVVVDGRFVEELKDISLKYRGSSNQRVISVKDGKDICE